MFNKILIYFIYPKKYIVKIINSLKFLKDTPAL